VFTVPNVTAIAFPRFNADNTVSTLDAASFRTAIGAGNGTVTSVAVSGGTTGLTTSGGPITTSGTITLGGTLAVTNGGTGATAAAGARTNLGATTLGANVFTVPNVTAIAFPRFNADNTVSTLDAASFRTAIGAGTGNGNGTVTSVATSGTVSGLTLTGGTITTTGTITLGGTLAVTPSNFASQTAKTVLAAPNAADGVPTFRLLVASDIPTLNQNTAGTAANVTGTVAVANGGTGATTAANALTSLGAYPSSNPSGYITNGAATAFPAGTVMMFAQTAAPTGWTKSTTHDNKALRVVSGTAGSGGTVAFTTAFASKAVSGTVSVGVSAGTLSVGVGTLATVSTTATGSVGATTISTSQMPSHQHSNTVGYTNVFGAGANVSSGGYGGGYSGTMDNVQATGGGGSHNHSFTGNGHTHTFTGSPSLSGSPSITSATFSGTAINLAVQYVDVIIATKN
jgi:hypothetical protein